MSMVSSRLAAVCGVGALGLGLGALAGCKRHPPAPAPATTAAVSSAPSVAGSADDGSSLEAAAAPAQCRRLAGFGLTLEAPPSPKPGKGTQVDAADEDDDALLPFGVDIGAAVPTIA